MKHTLSTLTLLAAVSLGVNHSLAGDADTLDAALLKKAPDIHKYLRDRNCQNVGVLKFLVQNGLDEPSDNIGPLNLSLPRRLEVALVLSAPDDKVGIARQASQSIVESRNRRANHLTAEGRRELFQTPLVLAWGTDDQPVKADCFLAGTARIAPDLSTTTVKIQAITKDQPNPADVCEFTVPTDARTLTEIGRSFRLRQLFPEIAEEPAKIAAQTAAGATKHPLQQSDLMWEIYYDSEAIPIVIKDGKASVKGPKEGQRVWFTLRNAGKERLGVVLRINGESTLFREKLPSSACRKWVLDPGERVAIRGYQTDEQSAAGFRVLSPELSEKEEINYGEHAGTFSVEAFASLPETPALPADDAKRKAVEIGELPSDKPMKLATLQQKLTEPFRGTPKVSSGLRQLFGQEDSGLVVPGQKLENKVERVTFAAGSVPILSATVRYHPLGK
jgi:hypothetical protein